VVKDASGNGHTPGCPAGRRSREGRDGFALALTGKSGMLAGRPAGLVVKGRSDRGSLGEDGKHGVQRPIIFVTSPSRGPTALFFYDRRALRRSSTETARAGAILGGRELA